MPPANRINLLVSRSIFDFVAVTFENIITGLVCHFAFGFTITPAILKFLALPLTYLNDASRAILIGQEPIIPLNHQFTILLLSMFVLLFIGSFVFYSVERRCRMKGELSGH